MLFISFYTLSLVHHLKQKTKKLANWPGYPDIHEKKLTDKRTKQILCFPRKHKQGT